MSAHGPDCVRALDSLYLFIDRELDEASWDEIHAHIADCEPCLTAFDLEKMVKTLVARSCTESAPAPLRDRVLTSIRTVSIEISENTYTEHSFTETTIEPPRD
ncbi:MAG: mycothiol system anti-sigma-R factor [Nocardioidaceae bacterium]|nr:mycothiol system anti-sigma-R factor [Nocardioidaceae bacterium]